MPKIIDADARRTKIAQAACRVIITDGLPALSLTAVAAEAGLAIGSVRHYVGGHDELRRLTLRIVGDDMIERLTDTARPLVRPSADLTLQARLRMSQEWLEQLLPMDVPRMREAIVWAAMREAARIDPELAEAMAGIEDQRLVLVRRVFGRIRPHWSHAVRDLEARRMSALLRGLALERVYAPHRVTPGQVRRVLRQHLEQLSDPRSARADRSRAGQ